jgi:hypothetical protein
VSETQERRRPLEADPRPGERATAQPDEPDQGHNPQQPPREQQSEAQPDGDRRREVQGGLSEDAAPREPFEADQPHQLDAAGQRRARREGAPEGQRMNLEEEARLQYDEPVPADRPRDGRPEHET